MRFRCKTMGTMVTNTFRTPKNEYLFIRGRFIEVSDDDDIEFFLQKSQRFETEEQYQKYLEELKKRPIDKLFDVISRNAPKPEPEAVCLPAGELTAESSEGTMRSKTKKKKK